jgi:hypothetical protein
VSLIDLKLSELPAAFSVTLAPSYGPGSLPEVRFELASNDLADLRTWASAIGGTVEEFEPSPTAGVWMVCAMTGSDINGLHVEVWQARPVAAPAPDAAVVR